MDRAEHQEVPPTRRSWTEGKEQQPSVGPRNLSGVGPPGHALLDSSASRGFGSSPLGRVIEMDLFSTPPHPPFTILRDFALDFSLKVHQVP